MKKFFSGIICVALITSVTAFSLAQAEGKKLEFKNLHELMEHMKKDCSALMKANKKGDLEAVAQHANNLARYAGITQKKFCPNKDFFQKAETMKKGANAVAKAASEKDANGVRKAFRQMMGACAICHKVYKKKKKK